MSERVINPIVERIRSREADRIQAMAAKAVAEHAILDEGIAGPSAVKERAKRFIGVMHNYQMNRRYRGFWRSLLTKERVNQTEFYLDYLESDYAAQSPNAIVNLVRHNKPIHIEEGHRTTPLSVEKCYIDELNFDVGWKIGVVKNRGIQTRQRATDEVIVEPHSPGSFTVSRATPHIAWETRGVYPVRIWEYARELSSGDEQLQLVIDVNTLNGSVITYTDGMVDDNLITLGKGATLQAFTLLGDGLRLLERGQ